MDCALLNRYGMLAVTGVDARAFLHAQLTNDIENLPPDRAALAGWCTAKGRLLATMLVIPSADGFLLQLARDIAPAVAKRLSMFVLRSKVKVSDESASLVQLGVWGNVQGVTWEGAVVKAPVDEGRYLMVGPGPSGACARNEEDWALAEIRAGRPFISAATQDQFVPQMVNLERVGGVNFQKGCYPGQEIVARAQYRGEVKRRMKQFVAPAGEPLKPGAEFNGGMVVDAAGGELLAVVPV